MLDCQLYSIDMDAMDLCAKKGAFQKAHPITLVWHHLQQEKNSWSVKSYELKAHCRCNGKRRNNLREKTGMRISKGIYHQSCFNMKGVKEGEWIRAEGLTM